MKTGVAALVGGIVGGLGVLCFLVAFGTDYWLLASDDCGHHTHYPTLPGTTTATATTAAATTIPPPTTTPPLPTTPPPDNTTTTPPNTTDAATDPSVLVANATLANISEARARRSVEEVTAAPSLVFHHEGFFWRCVFEAEASTHAILAVLFTNQPASKFCIHGYLFPLPVAVGPIPHPMYDNTAVFRGFWTVFIILALVAGLVGGFLLVCAVPFTSHKLYRLGGIFLITAACLFLLLVVLFVLWKELVDMRGYILQDRGHDCPDVQPEAHYGWSFMVAAAGIPLALLSGLLFFATGVHLQRAK
ncbi:transmembrane protein 182-like [Sardina pilchardus]|uniref:transmembrane protein 182-like n=1 Tax=Sardina pilchardus TaxID=27697 RepID=UPI002E0EEF37